MVLRWSARRHPGRPQHASGPCGDRCLLLNAVAFALIAQTHDAKGIVMIICAIFGFGMGMGYASIPNR